jgi:hypothetical protein
VGRRALGGVVGLALAAGASALAATAPVAPELRAVLPKLKAKTTIPVVLPSYFPYARANGRKLRTAGFANRSSWSVSLFYGANCGGANACTVGFLSGQRGGQPGPFAARVTLARGIHATYKPTTCGGSCSPAEIDWALNGVVYRFQLQVNARGDAAERTAMVRMANSAIAAGPRG